MSRYRKSINDIAENDRLWFFNVAEWQSLESKIDNVKKNTNILSFTFQNKRYDLEEQYLITDINGKTFMGFGNDTQANIFTGRVMGQSIPQSGDYLFIWDGNYWIEQGIIDSASIDSDYLTFTYNGITLKAEYKDHEYTGIRFTASSFEVPYADIKISDVHHFFEWAFFIYGSYYYIIYPDMTAWRTTNYELALTNWNTIISPTAGTQGNRAYRNHSTHVDRTSIYQLSELDEVGFLFNNTWGFLPDRVVVTIYNTNNDYGISRFIYYTNVGTRYNTVVVAINSVHNGNTDYYTYQFSSQPGNTDSLDYYNILNGTTYPASVDFGLNAIGIYRYIKSPLLELRTLPSQITDGDYIDEELIQSTKYGFAGSQLGTVTNYYGLESPNGDYRIRPFYDNESRGNHYVPTSTANAIRGRNTKYLRLEEIK